MTEIMKIEQNAQYKNPAISEVLFDITMNRKLIENLSG
jgi:hypothetical protein